MSGNAGGLTTLHQALPVNPKTYHFKGYTLYLRGHNLLFCRVWGYRYTPTRKRNAVTASSGSERYPEGLRTCLNCCGGGGGGRGAGVCVRSQALPKRLQYVEGSLSGQSVSVSLSLCLSLSTHLSCSRSIY